MIDWSSLSTSELLKFRGEINAELREPWRTVEALATNGNGSYPSPGTEFRAAQKLTNEERYNEGD